MKFAVWGPRAGVCGSASETHNNNNNNNNNDNNKHGVDCFGRGATHKCDSVKMGVVGANQPRGRAAAGLPNIVSYTKPYEPYEPYEPEEPLF